jgi:transposase
VTDLLQDDPQAVILAWDEAWVYAQTRPKVVWSPVGQTPEVWVSTQRDCVAFYAALNLRTGQEQAIMTDKLNQHTSVTFLEYLATLSPDQRILLICDNASWHKGLPMTHFLDQHSRLELFFLPVACPELNPQEHVWASVRRTLERLSPFRTFAQLAQAFLLTLRSTWVQPSLFELYAPSILSVLSV